MAVVSLVVVVVVVVIVVDGRYLLSPSVVVLCVSDDSIDRTTIPTTHAYAIFLPAISFGAFARVR